MKHTCVDRTPYTYIIKHIPSGRVYYGCKYAKNCHPSTFWIEYFTSSKYVKELIDKDGKDAFSFEIRKVFHSVDSCLKWEERVLRRLDAIHRDDFINKNVAGITPAMPGELNPMFGKSRPDSSARMKINNPMKDSSVVAKCIASKNKKRELGIHGSSRNKDETIKRTSERMKANNPMNDPSVSERARQTKIINGVYKKQRQCPYCGHTGAGPNLYRYHFKNCTTGKQDTRSS